jgi:hypothetical protein
MTSVVGALPLPGSSRKAAPAELPEIDLIDLFCGQRSDNTSPRMASLMASWHPVGRTLHLRRWHRIPLQVPVTVALWEERAGAAARAWPAVLKDVCPGGLSFNHEEPISTRRAAVLLRDSSGRAAGWLVRLTWCRFTRCNIYQSGGAVVRSLDAAEVRGVISDQ